MEAGIKDSNQPPVKAEEEALKRNTDCVYFLASPLTCKKGSECEYRHSEYARVNPRDCWFWLNGNCLNPKCAFRHPPLEGLLGTPTASSEGPSLTTSKSAALAQPTAASTSAYASSKQPVPCIYFQKGLCLKGDRCSFVHGTPPISNPAKQMPAPKVAKSFTELQTLTKGLGDLQKCNEKQKIAQVNTIKSEKVPPPLKPAMQAEIALPNNGAVKKSIFPPPLSNNELPRYKSTNIPQVMSGNSVIMPLQIHQAQAVDDYSFQNGKEAGEFLGESSPGFDVLVDDELEDSDYYHNEDEFGRGSGHEGIHMNSMNEFNHREPYNDSVDYDKYSRAWEPQRASSERILERESIPEKREFLRGRSPDRINESDLRHRLSKQRRVSGSRSAVSPNSHGDLYRREERDWHGEEKRFRGYSERSSGSGSHHLPSRGNRLQGRIKLPDRFSPDNDRNGFRNRPQLSPSKPPISSHQERHKDRLKQRVQEELIPEGRNFKGQFMRNYDVNFNTTTDFSGPKSLAELKGAKVSENSEDQSVNLLREQKNTRNPKFVGHQESEGDLSFEGPKPLSMILKRKREAVGSGSGTDSGNGRERNQKESERNLTGRSRTDLQRIFPSGSKEETNHYTPTHMTEPSYDTGDTGKMVEEEKGQVSHEDDDSSYIQKEGDIETEDGLIVNGAMEDQEFETFEQGDEEYDYEHEDDAELKVEEDENAEPDEEYFDDEDGDDFAKRIGVMFS